VKAEGATNLGVEGSLLIPNSLYYTAKASERPPAVQEGTVTSQSHSVHM